MRRKDVNVSAGYCPEKYAINIITLTKSDKKSVKN